VELGVEFGWDELLSNWELDLLAIILLSAGSGSVSICRPIFWRHCCRLWCSSSGKHLSLHDKKVHAHQVDCSYSLLTVTSLVVVGRKWGEHLRVIE
jgi:hypothetical protein